MQLVAERRRARRDVRDSRLAAVPPPPPSTLPPPLKLNHAIDASPRCSRRASIARRPACLDRRNCSSLSPLPPPQPLLLLCHPGARSRRLYILCWNELSRRKLSMMLATPTTLVLTTLVAQCELSRRKIGLLLEVVGQKVSHRPGNPATVGVVRWPAAGDTAGSSLPLLSSLQHRIYNLLDVCSVYVHLILPLPAKF